MSLEHSCTALLVVLIFTKTHTHTLDTLDTLDTALRQGVVGLGWR